MKMKSCLRFTAAITAALFLVSRPLTAVAETPAGKPGESSALMSKLKELGDLFGGEPAPETGDPFVRYLEEAGTGRLQVRDIRFQGPQGEKLELTGAIHIGDKSYYEEINAHLRQFDAVLFEMVASPEDIALMVKGEKRAERKEEQVSLTEIYKMLADDILHLTSQMDHVDYRLPSMVHADFTDKEFGAALKERGLSPEELTGSVSPGRLKLMLRIIKFFIPADDPAAVKRLMAPMFGRMASGMAGNAKLEELIINERNKRVMEVLGQQLAAGKKNIGIFYGAGHFTDLTTRLEEKGWKQTGDNWRTAWTIPAQGTQPPRAEPEKAQKAAAPAAE